MIGKAILIVVGTLSLIFGILGIFLPLLPTTPFLLFSAWCYLRSSHKLYKWLISRPYLGRYILNYREGKGIPLQAKSFTLLLLWVTMSSTILFVVPNIFGKIALLIIALGVSVHIMRIPTTVR
ncbi:MAG: DUF454 domain-containing protein [Candidatus Margulisiibacteriota bacterium]|nr:MAG: hypothetical protein A2X43_08775 [Candidatus Margulisbacteria bacterium GWD2_39_127]OGI01666.1 MAG: hypothetical protein A2X42_04900 [Candidatus Margulisbacteria bacterium GWF2_38_17]OGI05859.1 MAG: hypothetical protein A2X41_04475 [Candidatus Margulisbacteria bacterium GWE2_39_32]PZM81859.1 MAG: DUF454 domain-containing protein [Candidatus Margulisiibacteriota bacterium]HAR63117.1 DUF454 domain-containing protein [Candidatus Margulisiibacteriota bacterium]